MICFCDDANLEPGMPPSGQGKWRFLHQLNDEEIEVDYDVSVEHSDGVDSTPM